MNKYETYINILSYEGRQIDLSFLHANAITSVGDERAEFVFDFSSDSQKM